MEPEEVLSCLETLHLTPQEFMYQRENELATVRAFASLVLSSNVQAITDLDNPTSSRSASL